jgi:hypothetical protein
MDFNDLSEKEQEDLFTEEIWNKRYKIDPDDTLYDWSGLIVGWAIGKGLDFESAWKFESRILSDPRFW